MAKRKVDLATLERDANEIPSTVDTAAVQHLMDVAEELEQLTMEVDEEETRLKEKKSRLTELKTQTVPELMQSAGLVAASGKGSFTLRSGAKIHLKTDMHINVTKEQKPAVITWLKKNKHGDLVKEEVNTQTLKAFCRERMEDGDKLPPGVTPYFETSAVFNRAK